MIDQLISALRLSDVQISADGRYVAFGLGESGKADKNTPRQSAIYVVDVETGNMRCFTGSNTSTNCFPCWSPDGQWLAFLSNRTCADEMQLYLLAMGGGEAQALTDLRGMVARPQWSPDGNAIAFLCGGHSDQKIRIEPDPIVVDEFPDFNRVWLLTNATRQLRPITPETYHIFEYCWSPDGSRIAVLASSHPNPAEGWYHAQIYVVALDTGDMQQICAVEHQIGNLTWSPNGASIAFISGIMSDEGNISGDIYIAPAAGGQAQCITPGIDCSITWIEWRRQGIFYGGRQVESAVLGCIDPQTETMRVICNGLYSFSVSSSQQIEQISIARNNTFATIRESFNEAPDIYIGSLKDGQWRRLTHLPVDPQLPPLSHVENKYWTGADGMPIHGYLIYPPDYDPNKRYPLFLNVHGGPTWSYTPRYFNNWARLLAARGYLVLMPNPRGSPGRGHAFQSANVGDLGGADWQDVSAGVDYLIQEGLVDPERLGIGGWSYGGYLTTWAITQTNRFRCAIAGASITNYQSNYGTVSNREWQTTMFGSYVYDEPDLHRSRSPITHVKCVKTPTLLVHGACDTLAPVGQSIEFYTALRHLEIPTQLVIYPREPHGFIEQAHQRDLYQRIVAWVDKYL